MHPYEVAPLVAHRSDGQLPRYGEVADAIGGVARAARPCFSSMQDSNAPLLRRRPVLQWRGPSRRR
jgi:hypothetical protein